MTAEQLLKDTDYTIRTQISLSPTLKKYIEEKTRLTGESMSAYIRESVKMRALDEDDEKKRLERLARNLIGSLNMKKHPEWSTDSKLQKWLRALRKDKP